MSAQPKVWEDYILVAAAIGLAYFVRKQHLSDSKPKRDNPTKPRLPLPRSEYKRGRSATAPWRIPWLGWKDILIRTYEQINNDRLLAIAAGVVFYGLLAFFPAITALVSSYGLFADPSTIAKNLQGLAAMMPPGSYTIVEDQIARVLSKGSSTLSFTFAFGLVVAIWSANAGVKAIMDALNVVYGERESRSFIKLNLISLTFTAGLLASLLLMLGAVIVIPLTFDRFGLHDSSAVIVRYARWPLLGLLLLAGLSVLYRYGPSRAYAKWKWLSVGALAAAIFWIAGSAAFSYYLTAYAQYDATYGSLGTAIGLMTWMWMSAIVVLFGAELNSEIEHQTARDSTTGSPAPRGQRGAVMADNIGQARSS